METIESIGLADFIKQTLIPEDKGEYVIFRNAHGDRAVEAKDGSFHMIFKKDTGFTAKWGKTFDEDPTHCPFGNEIADIEITKACRGIRDENGARHPCKFCFPAGTLITLDDGKRVPIESIKPSDRVLSMHFAGAGNSFIRGEVQEVYERDYTGELIVIELENGKTVEATPEHPFLLRDGTEVLAKDLTGEEDLVAESEYTHCSTCGKPKLPGQFFSRYYCSEECQTSSKGNCLLCGKKKYLLKEMYSVEIVLKLEKGFRSTRL